MNHVIIKGRLGADPELRYAGNGTAIVSFNVATDESYTDQQGNKVERTEWHKVTFFQRTAETVAKHFVKGQEILVTGKIQTEKYTDRDNIERYVTKIIGQRFEFCGSRSDSGNSNGNGNQQASGQQRPPQQQRQQQQRQPQQQQPDYDDDLGPAFPSDASGMDDVPFNSVE